MWSENGGGGAVTMPYALIDGSLYVGVIEEKRDLMGGEIQNVPRGFLGAAEAHDETAERELSEETGLVDFTSFVERLPGEYVNMNSAFFDTRGSDQGVQFYAVEIAPEHLEEIDGILRIRFGLLDPEAQHSKRFMATRFIPWRSATELADGFTGYCLARLLARLVSEDVL